MVLGIDHPYSKEGNSAAEVASKAILESRGNTPRLYRNTLVFLAVDKTRLQDLDEAVRYYLAWESILAEKEKLNLDPQQVKQAETQRAAADSTVTARIPEAYQWLLVPVQPDPKSAVKWEAYRLTGQNPLAVRASKKLKNDELLITSFAASRLQMELDKIPLWPGNHVAIKQLIEYFARYLYLPRLAGPGVLVNAIREGLALITWEKDAFAYAESYDEAEGRYRGLRAGRQVPITDSDAPGLLVKPEIARRQMDAERPVAPGPGAGTVSPGEGGSTALPGGGVVVTPPPPSPAETPKPKRFHGTVKLDPARVGRDAGRIADEVISHLAGLVGSSVTVTLEIEAEVKSGTPDNVVRTVTENCRTLKFTSQGFEKE